ADTVLDTGERPHGADGRWLARGVHELNETDGASPPKVCRDETSAEADQPLLDRFEHRLAARAHLELLVDVAHVRRDGVERYTEQPRDLGEAEPLADQVQHLVLALRQQPALAGRCALA